MATLHGEISTLTIPACLPYADLAAVYVTAVANYCGFAADQSQRLGQSLLLTLQDLLQRAFEPHESKELHLSCQCLPFGLTIIIKEQGLPLAPEELASLGADPQVCPRMDLGSHLVCVRDVWDEASFHNLGRSGAEVHLSKYLPASGRGPEPGDCQITPVAAPSSPPPGEPLTLQLRPFVAADAQAVVRLLYRTYGYSYPFENLYYPEQLIAMNAGGSLQSLLAVTLQGELVGHLAMFFVPEHPDMAEIGTAAVDPDFRGHGCLHQLTEFAVAEARRRRLAALYGRPVTNHVYSQKVAAEVGFTPCGLLVGLGPASMSFKKIHEDLAQRESMVLIYRSLIPVSPAKIFPPIRHRDFIRKLYARLGMRPELAPPDGDAPPADSQAGQMDIHTFQDAGVAIIRIKTIGPETFPELRRHLRHLCQSRFEAIQLELDLRQPRVFHLVPQCESLGFFFSGILPYSNGPQALLLQYLNNVPLDYAKIQLQAPLAQEILAYIKQQDPNRL